MKERRREVERSAIYEEEENALPKGTTGVQVAKIVGRRVYTVTDQDEGTSWDLREIARRLSQAMV